MNIGWAWAHRELKRKAPLLAKNARNGAPGTLKHPRIKISWTICRIPVRPFDYIVKAGQPARRNAVTGRRLGPLSGGKRCGRRKLAQSQSKASHYLLCS